LCSLTTTHHELIIFIELSSFDSLNASFLGYTTSLQYNSISSIELYNYNLQAYHGNASDAVGVKSSETSGPDNLQLPDQLPAQYQELMRTWLVHRSTCPVEYVWTDLGKSFWPRWIKNGRCGRSETMSCSWPPGMSCMPSSIKVLNLLRWHCWWVGYNKVVKKWPTCVHHLLTLLNFKW